MRSELMISVSLYTQCISDMFSMMLILGTLKFRVRLSSVFVPLSVSKFDKLPFVAATSLFHDPLSTYRTRWPEPVSNGSMKSVWRLMANEVL